MARTLGLAQVVWWQVAVVLGALALRQPWPVAVALGLSAAAVVALTAVRVHERWLYDVTITWLRFTVRARRHPLPADDGLAPTLLDVLLGNTTVSTVDSSGAEAMTISHPRGLCAVLRPTEVTPAALETFASPADLLPTGDGSPHDFAVQTVFHCGMQRGTPPRLWLAVHAGRTVTSPLDEELILALRNALRRIRKALTRAGIGTEPLGETAGFAAVTALAHVTGGRNELRETWRCVRTGPVAQACFTLDGWDGLSATEAHRLVGVIRGHGSGTALTLTLSARATETAPLRISALLRLAATTEAAIDAVAARLSPLLHPAGVRVTRLDGDHTSGITASLPIGGSLS